MTKSRALTRRISRRGFMVGTAGAGVALASDLAAPGIRAQQRPAAARVHPGGHAIARPEACVGPFEVEPVLAPATQPAATDGYLHLEISLPGRLSGELPALLDTARAVAKEFGGFTPA